MFWPACPVHLPEIRLHHPSVRRARSDLATSSRKKLASLIFAAAQGLSFSFYSQITPAGAGSGHRLRQQTGLVSRLQQLEPPPTPPDGASGPPRRIPARTGSPVHLSPAVDFKIFLCISLKIGFLPSENQLFHTVSQR